MKEYFLPSIYTLAFQEKDTPGTQSGNFNIPENHKSYNAKIEVAILSPMLDEHSTLIEELAS